MVWENIFVNHIYDKELVSRIEKELLRLNNKKESNPIFNKWMKDITEHFSQEDLQVTRKHMKRYSTSLVIRKMQIKPQWDINLHPLQTAIVKEKVLTKLWRNCMLLMQCKMVQALWRIV